MRRYFYTIKNKHGKYLSDTIFPHAEYLLLYKSKKAIIDTLHVNNTDKIVKIKITEIEQ